MGPKTQKLIQHLSELLETLNLYNQTHWAEQIEKDISTIKSGDFYGIENFLSTIGGMGSLNDLVFHPANGHTIDLSQVDRVNAQFQDQLNQAYVLAKEIKKEQA